MDRGYSRRCGDNGTALRGWSAFAATLLLAACASDEPRGPAGGGVQAERSESSGPGAPGPRTRPSLFISPAGEPFRAGPGDAYPVGVWFRQADADGDGKLNRDEFTADAARFFQKLDANHDGVIDGAEVKAYETEMVPEITADRPGAGGAQGGSQGSQRSGAGGQGSGGQGGGGRRGRRGGGGGFGGGQNGQGGQGQGGGSGGATPQAEGAAPYGLLGEREPVAAADLELNSRITLASFRTKAAQRFGRLDVDGKGYLLLAELPKTPAQKGGRRGRGGQPRPPQSPPNGG